MKRLLYIFVLITALLYGAFTTRNFSEILGGTQPATCTVGDVAFDTDNGVTLRCTAADTWTEVALPPAYGQLWEHNAGGTVINIATGGTFVQWVSSTVGEYSLTTPSAGTDNITIDAGSGGMYLVGFHASYTGNANEVFHWAVFVEGVAYHRVASERKAGAGDVGSQSGIGIVPLAATDVVDLRVTSTNDTKTATVNHVSLTLTRIGL